MAVVDSAAAVEVDSTVAALSAEVKVSAASQAEAHTTPTLRRHGSRLVVRCLAIGLPAAL
jgi:hypothetical protein